MFSMMRGSNTGSQQLKLEDFEDKTLLIVDDDDPLRGRLARAMEKKGFQVKGAKTVSEAIQIAKNSPPSFAVVDLRLEDGNGLDFIKELTKVKKDTRIVMLTGYGNLPTAVAAVKAGAIDYIAKPVDADDVESALMASPESKQNENPMSADRVKWEHIHEFLSYNRNVLRQQDDLKCTEELCKEFYLKDHQNKIVIFLLQQLKTSLASFYKSQQAKRFYT